MVEIMIVVVGVAVFLAVLSGLVWVICRVINGFFVLSLPLRGHVFAATIWTLVTAFYTLSFALADSGTPNDAVGAGILLVAGWTMVSSWAQFIERRDGAATLRQARRPLLIRLFVQTIWGVVAVWLAAWGVTASAEALFDTAIRRHDKTSIEWLKRVGLAADINDAKYQNRLVNAIQSQDEDAVSALVYAGVSPMTWNYDEQGTAIQFAVRFPSTTITATLLDGAKLGNSAKETETDILRSAIVHEQFQQVKFLLHRGFSLDGRPLAKDASSPAIIALLKAAGATK